MGLRVLMILPIGRAKALLRETQLGKLVTKQRKILIQGLTLIELLLVVAIIVVLAGLNLPAFKATYNHLKLENCALNILALSRFAEQKAIVESRIYRLNFDSINKVYWLTILSENPEQEKPQELTGRFGRRFQIPTDINLAVSLELINFYPSAESDNATIALSNEQGARFELTKSGAFGGFEIQEKR